MAILGDINFSLLVELSSPGTFGSLRAQRWWAVGRKAKGGMERESSHGAAGGKGRGQTGRICGAKTCDFAVVHFTAGVGFVVCCEGRRCKFGSAATNEKTTVKVRLGQVGKIPD